MQMNGISDCIALKSFPLYFQASSGPLFQLTEFAVIQIMSVSLAVLCMSATSPITHSHLLVCI